MKYYSIIFLFFIVSLQRVTAQQKPDTMPVYPGCEKEQAQMSCFKEKLLDHISTHFDTQLLDTIQDTKQVSMLIYFHIDIDGKLKKIVVQSPYEQLNTAMKSVIESAPTVLPAKAAGQPIMMQYRLPVVFEIKK